MLSLSLVNLVFFFYLCMPETFVSVGGTVICGRRVLFTIASESISNFPLKNAIYRHTIFAHRCEVAL